MLPYAEAPPPALRPSGVNPLAVGTVAIALGSNMGDRVAALRAAVARIATFARDCSASSIYACDAEYVEDQPEFLNGVVVATVDLGPLSLLDRLKETEREIGRTSRPRFHAREIDLDLVAYGSLSLVSERLTVPHPMAAQRRFVLEPLAEVDPDFLLPGMGRAQELLDSATPTTRPLRPTTDALLPIHRT